MKEKSHNLTSIQAMYTFRVLIEKIIKLFLLTKKLASNHFCLVIIFLLLFQISSYSQYKAESFVFEDKIRDYHVYVPQNFMPNMPLVLNLHGFTMSPISQASYTLMHKIADTSGFIVVYPTGSYNSHNRGWNTGLRGHPFGVQDSTSNDVGFLNALIDTLHANYKINLNRVYCCGYSMGGEMTYRMAIQSGDRFAAFASFAGKLNDISANSGIPARAFNILHIHGTADNTETWDGRNDGNLWAVEETINYWIENNACSLDPDTLLLPDLDVDDGCEVQKIRYQNCANETEVILYKVINGDHSWPGASGSKIQDINASVEICNFFLHDYNDPYANIAFGKEISIFPKFIKPHGDSIKITGEIVNNYNHPISVFALVKAKNSSFSDSIQLYDDGIHNDGDPNDNIYGNTKWYPNIHEDVYVVNLLVHDSIENTCHNLVFEDYFTNLGPVVFEDYAFGSIDYAGFYPDSIAGLNIVLKNNSTTHTASNIKVSLKSLDAFTYIRNAELVFDDIPPQWSSRSETYQKIKIKRDTPVDSVAYILVEIYSHSLLCWTDTFSITIQEPLWIPQASRVNKDLYSVYFTDANTGTAVGRSGTILRTTDGGTTWNEQESGVTTDYLWDVCFTDINTGIVVGKDGTILKTSNGGENWYSVSGGGTIWLKSVCFMNDSTGIIVGEGTILRTSDAGETWESVFNDKKFGLMDVFFSDANTGTAVGGDSEGGAILRTIDGGKTWESQSSGTTNTLMGVYFSDDNTGTVVGYSGTILRTIDGGETWNHQSSSANSDIKDVYFTDANTGTVVGGTGFGGDHNGEIFHTTDGGTTWTNQLNRYPYGLHCVHFTHKGTGITVGTDGSILRTSNGGVSWQQDDIQFEGQKTNDIILLQNSPNPFCSSTAIRFCLLETCSVSLKVYDIFGKEVAALINEKRPAGEYTVTWNGSNTQCPNGIYLYEIKTDNSRLTRKMLFIK